MTVLKKYMVLLISCLLFLTVSGLLSIYSIGQSMASSPVIIGSDVGLSVNPPDASVFTITNIYPGKTEKSQITIKNEGSSPFNLTITVISEGDSVLIDVLYLKISDNLKVYYNGLMSGTHSIDLGNISAGETRLLDLTVSMATEAGNETQNKSFDTTWIFHAVSPGVPSPVVPRIPDIPSHEPINDELSDRDIITEEPGEGTVETPPEEVQVQPEEPEEVQVQPEEAQVQPKEAPPGLDEPIRNEVPDEQKIETPPTGASLNYWLILLLTLLIAFWVLAVSAPHILLTDIYNKSKLMILKLTGKQ